MNPDKQIKSGQSKSNKSFVAIPTAVFGASSTTDQVQNDAGDGGGDCSGRHRGDCHDDAHLL